MREREEGRRKIIKSDAREETNTKGQQDCVLCVDNNALTQP